MIQYKSTIRKKNFLESHVGCSFRVVRVNKHFEHLQVLSRRFAHVFQVTWEGEATADDREWLRNEAYLGCEPINLSGEGIAQQM